MRLSCLVLAAALAFAASGAGASASPGPLSGELQGDLIRSCLTELRALSKNEGHSETHNFDLEVRCPRLAASLAASPAIVDSAALEIGAINVEGLRDLLSYSSGFNRKPAAERFSPDHGGLGALIDEVLIVAETEDGVWDRFLRWLEQYVRDGASPGLERFAKWLKDIDAPPWLGDVLLKGSIVLIVLLAIIVVGNEIRLSGLLRRKWRPRKAKTEAAAPSPEPRPPIASLDELRGLPTRQLAAGILEYVTAVFAERGWLSSSTSLTNGELVREVSRRKSSLAGPFIGLVGGVEKIIYGDRLPDDEARQQLFDAAVELVEGARSAGTAASMARR
jgi:hypothetical protein